MKLQFCFITTKQNPPNRVVSVLALFPYCTCPEHPAHAKREQGRTLRFRLRNARVKRASKYARPPLGGCVDIGCRWFEPSRGSQNGATILHPNTKVLNFQGFFVFLGVKNKHSSTLHLLLTLLDLNLQLVCLCSKCGIDI